MLRGLFGGDRVKSRIHVTDATWNDIRKFGEADSYADFYVEFGGKLVPARITLRALVYCVETGRKQASEVKPPARWWHLFNRY